MKLNGNIVITLDDILFESSKSLYRFIRNNYYPDYCTVFKEPDYEFDFDKRESKNIFDSIIDPKTSPALIYAISPIIIHSYFSNKETFKNYLEPSNLYQKIINSIGFLESNVIDRIYIFYNNTYDFILELLQPYFKNKKFILVPIDVANDKKEENYFNKLSELKWNLLISDDIQLIESVATKNESLAGKEFLIPNRSYCKVNDIIEMCIEEKGGTINYY